MRIPSNAPATDHYRIGSEGVPLAAAYEADDETARHPDHGTAPWADWVSASNTLNYCCEDPVLDWLAEHGMSKGHVPDDQRSQFDVRTDFRRFLSSKTSLTRPLNSFPNTKAVGGKSLVAYGLRRGAATCRVLQL